MSDKNQKNNKFAYSNKTNNYNFKNTKRNDKKYTLGSQKVADEQKKPIFIFEDFIKETKFYTLEHSNSDKNSLYNFLNAIKDISEKTWREMKINKSFHAHGIDSEISNIPELNSFDNDIPFFQFKLPNHDKGRFIGYFDDKAFFHIVLYDRNHQFYKRK